MKIGIIGQGFVGSAIREGLKNFYKVRTYDIDEEKCNSTHYDVFICDKVINSETYFSDSKTSRSDIPIKFVSKGWGFEKWIVNCDKYCGKLLYFAKGRRCSWHYHKIKDEVFYIQSGKIKVKYSDNDDILLAKECILGPGDNFHVYTGLRHQMIALEDTELFEFSTQHFDSDSHRLIKGD